MDHAYWRQTQFYSLFERSLFQNVLKKKKDDSEQTQLVKFREVSGTVWVSFEAMVTEKTTQEE